MALDLKAIITNKENYYGQATYYCKEVDSANWRTTNVNDVNSPYKIYVNGSTLIVFKTDDSGILVYMFSEDFNAWRLL